MSAVADIQDLFAYNRWANRRLLAVSAGLTPDQLGRDLGSSFPSVHDTLVHMLGAEWVWFSRWKGTSPTRINPDWDLSTHADIEARWAELDGELQRFVATLTPEQLEADVSYRNTKGTPYTARLVDLMRHVVNHASYHRGQIATMIRQLGVGPVSTDLVLYHRERDGAG